MFDKSWWSDVLHGDFCPGSILPVHPDAVENDSEANVLDDEDEANNQRKNYQSQSFGPV